MRPFYETELAVREFDRPLGHLEYSARACIRHLVHLQARRQHVGTQPRLPPPGYRRRSCRTEEVTTQERRPTRAVSSLSIDFRKTVAPKRSNTAMTTVVPPIKAAPESPCVMPLNTKNPPIRKKNEIPTTLITPSSFFDAAEGTATPTPSCSIYCHTGRDAASSIRRQVQSLPDRKPMRSADFEAGFHKLTMASKTTLN